MLNPTVNDTITKTASVEMNSSMFSSTLDVSQFSSTTGGCQPSDIGDDDNSDEMNFELRLHQLTKTKKNNRLTKGDDNTVVMSKRGCVTNDDVGREPSSLLKQSHSKKNVVDYAVINNPRDENQKKQ